VSGCFQFIGLAAGDEDICPGFRETASHGFAESFAAACDESGFAFEIEEWVRHVHIQSSRDRRCTDFF
jgi:hypothetical protein